MDAGKSLLLLLGVTFLMSGECAQLLQHTVTTVCSGPCCLECLKSERFGAKNVQESFQGNTEEVYGCYEQECSLDSNTEYAIDNDFSTVWNSSAIYNSSSLPVLMGLTLNLGQGHRVQKIEVYGKVSVPTISTSSDGVEFDQLEHETYNETSHKTVMVHSLKEVTGAKYIHLQFSDVELPQITEVYIFVSQESCGFCIFGLTNTLTNLTVKLTEAFQLLGDDSRLELLLKLLQDHLEDVLQLESTVLRLQLNLQAKTMLQINMTEFEVIQIHGQFKDYLENQRDLVETLASYVEEISELEERIALISHNIISALNITLMGISDSQAISTSLISGFAMEILIHKQDVGTMISRANTFAFATEVIHTMFQEITSLLDSSVITSLGLISASVKAITTATMNNSVVANATLMEISKRESILTSYNEINAESKQAISIGQSLLNGTNLEPIKSSLTQLPLVSFTLKNGIEGYQFAIENINVCNPGVCTHGHLNAESLHQNYSIILNASLFTLQRSKTFIGTTVNNSELFNDTELNSFAQTVLNITRSVDIQLSVVGVDLLSTKSSFLQETAATLYTPIFQLVDRIQDLSSAPEGHQENYSKLVSLFVELNLTAVRISSYEDELSTLADSIGNIGQVKQDAEIARNLTELSNNKVALIDPQILGRSVENIAVNTMNASVALDTSEANFEGTRLFLNATRGTVKKFSANVSEFVAENRRIIGEINQIIASLENIHTRINAINSPILLSSVARNNSYVSLQPPPGRSIDDKIQFESIDLYLWTGPEFRTPSVLFYAGAACSMINNDVYNSDDYFTILLENDGMISVHWKVGNETGTALHAGFQPGFSQIHVARIGASFELRYGVSIGQLGDPFTFGTVSNYSVLFMTTNRTEFLLGGFPDRSQTDCFPQALQADSYSSFEGQIQQLLFNGEQWGLWNIRSASKTTFHGEFQRNELATVNAWHASQSSTAAAISFDGKGYLYVNELSSTTSFSTSIRQLVITLRPNDESSGLVLYAYDTTINLSMEIYFDSGKLILLMTRHDNNVTLIDYVQQLDRGIITSETRQLQIVFAEGVGFQVNGETFIDSENAVFFSDLTNVNAWFGGINENSIDDRIMFTRSGTSSGYFGCVDIAIITEFASNIFEGDHFIRHYLNSPVQRGFSATCLQTIYTSEVGFDGTSEAFLAYNSLETVEPPNSPTGFDQSEVNQRNIISFSFYSQEPEGTILILQNEDGSELYTVMHNSFLEVRITFTSSGERTTLFYKEEVTVKDWHSVLIQYRVDDCVFYLDGVVRASSEASSSFIELGPRENSNTPVMFIGGIDGTLRNNSFPSFTGCLRDLAFGHMAFSFLNGAQFLPQYPPGVTFHSCPFINSTAFLPVLSVFPDQPAPNTCMSPPSVTTSSHGGFHKQTRLTTSNIIGLLRRSWHLEVTIRYVDDGHILSFVTAEGYMVSLTIQDRQPTLIVAGISVTLQQVTGIELEEKSLIDLVISCSSNSTAVSCFLFVNHNQSEVIVIESGSFIPEPPIVFGQATLYDGGQVDSFVGCVNSIAINGDVSGFENLYTGFPCYTNIEQGIGFTGISLLQEEIVFAENDPLTVSITVRSAQADGLIMILTIANNSEAIFAAGLRNGRIQVSNLRDIAGEGQVDVCDANNNTFHNFEVILQNKSIIIITSENVSMTIPTAPANGLVTLSIGNTPDGFAENGQLSFLLSDRDERRTRSLPGLIGCILEVKINDVLYNDLFDVAKNILSGVCPK